MVDKELKNQTVDDLKGELLSLRKEQFNLRLQKGVGQQIKPHLLKKVRRSIARIKTVLKEKGLSV